MTNKTAHYYAHIMRSLVCIITKYIISICHSSTLEIHVKPRLNVQFRTWNAVRSTQRLSWFLLQNAITWSNRGTSFGLASWSAYDGGLHSLMGWSWGETCDSHLLLLFGTAFNRNWSLLLPFFVQVPWERHTILQTLRKSRVRRIIFICSEKVTRRLSPSINLLTCRITQVQRFNPGFFADRGQKKVCISLAFWTSWD